VATSVSSICRQALHRIGANVESFSIGGDTAEERACNLWYEQCRDALLTEAPWPFANSTATLNRIADLEPMRRQYGYTLPADCLKVLDIWTGNLIDNPESRTVFEYEQNEGVRILVTDSDVVKVTYTARIEDPLQFPPLFVDALAAGLAARLSFSLEKGDPNGLRQQYMYEREHAAAVVLNEIPLEPDPLPRRIAGRGV
jgi:hypothetical protein